MTTNAVLIIVIILLVAIIGFMLVKMANNDSWIKDNKAFFKRHGIDDSRGKNKY